MSAVVPDCCLCSQIAGNPDGDLISRLSHDETYVRRIPIESANFAVVPSLGPVVPGHSLIVPKAHFKSFSDVLRGTNYAGGAELQALRRSLSGVLSTLYQAPVHQFEHGSPAGNPKVLCTVDHAHLHFLPTSVNIQPRLSEDSRWAPCPGGLERLASSTSGKEYMFYESPTGNTWFAVSVEGFESQYLRRLFAEETGMSANWNWRENPQPASVNETFRKLLAFRTCLPSVPLEG